MNAHTELNIGQLAQMAHDIREEKRQLEKEAAECGRRLEEMKGMIHDKLVEQGVDRTSVNGITLSISDKTLPTVTDWDALHQFIIDSGQLVLLQRRISSAVWKEMLELGIDVPGVESFTKYDVNIRVS